MDPLDLMAQVNARLANMPSIGRVLGLDASPAALLKQVEQAQTAVQALEAQRQQLEQRIAAAQAARAAAKPAPPASAATPPPTADLTAAKDDETRAVRAETRSRFVKVTARRAAEVAGQCPLGQDALALLDPEQRPRQYFLALVEAGLYEDAVKFLAYALPPREAVWWGCLCLQLAAGDGLPPPQRAAVRAATRWVVEPGEAQCRAAAGPSEAAPLTTPAGMLAAAVFWTGGSLTLPPLPRAAVPPGLPARTVAAAILLAALPGGPAQLAHRQRQFLVLGSQVAGGELTWE